MQIQADPPFEITRGADGAHHAARDIIQVTVTPDLGEVDMRHRVGHRPRDTQSSRWLVVSLAERGVYLYVQGTHVVVSARPDYLPTFDLVTPADFVAEALRYLKVEKDERGRYVVDTPKNRRVLARLAEGVQMVEKNRLLAWARHALARISW